MLNFYSGKMKTALATVAIGIGLIGPAAAWDVVTEESRLNFVSTKKKHVAEVHSFKTLTGSISEGGTARIIIDASSVQSDVAIRKERLMDILFQVAQFPELVITADLDLSEFDGLAIGEATVSFVSGGIAAFGATWNLDFDALVTRVAEDKVRVEPAQPIIMNAIDLDVVEKVEALRELAKLDSISYAVPVDFSLTLQN